MDNSGFFEGDTITVDFIDVDAGQRPDGTQFDILLVSAAMARGGMSTVLRGNVETVVGDDLEVAVKVIRNVEGELGHQLLRRELAVVQNARHDFIVPFLGAADLDDRLVIVSPFMRNGNLLQYLRINPEADRLLLVLQVADAVFYLHTSLNIVHGDLKCENVLVSDDGTALLTDFGLSTTVDKPDGEGTTRTGIRDWNTIRFAAPELLVDNARSPANRRRSKTPQTDIYAFGMLVLQAFTGQQPWPGCSRYQVVARVLNRNRPHPRPGPEVTELGFDDRLWNLCLACWKRKPEARPTMRKVRGDLAMIVAAHQSGAMGEENFENSDIWYSPTLPAAILRPAQTRRGAWPAAILRARTKHPIIALQIGRGAHLSFFFFLFDSRRDLCDATERVKHTATTKQTRLRPEADSKELA